MEATHMKMTIVFILSLIHEKPDNAHSLDIMLIVGVIMDIFFSIILFWLFVYPKIKYKKGTGKIIEYDAGTSDYYSKADVINQVLNKNTIDYKEARVTIKGNVAPKGCRMRYIYIVEYWD